MSNLTVLTLIPNGYKDRLARCLESVAWADEVFCVVDPKISDGSDEIARQYTKRVVVHEYVNAAAQRNWALPQITTEWTLVLDADEWLSDELAARIRAVVAAPSCSGDAEARRSEFQLGAIPPGGGTYRDGYEIRRLSYFFGRLIRHCGWHHDYNLRLFRTKKGRYLDRRVHSRVVVDGTVGRMDEPMYHDTYRDFDEYFSTFQRFTTWSAQDMYDAGKRARLSDLTFRPFLRFIKMYLIRQGFRDGYHGAVLCGLSAFHVFTKYAKLWNLNRLADTNR